MVQVYGIESGRARGSPEGGGFLGGGFRLAAGGFASACLRFWAAMDACCDWNRFSVSFSADMAPALSASPATHCSGQLLGSPAHAVMGGGPTLPFVAVLSRCWT